MRKSTNITEKKHVVSNDNEAGTEETGLDTVEKDNRGKSKLFNLKDTATLQDVRNCLCLLQLKSLQILIELNIDSANFRFPFSTKCKLSEKKRSELRGPFAKVQKLSQSMYMKNDLEHFAFKIWLTSLISTRLTDQLASRGSIPPMVILIELQLDEMIVQFLQYHLQCLQVNLGTSYLSHLK